MVEGINLTGKEKVTLHPNSVPDSPLLSVCIQTYNHAQYIKECLDSVLNQKVGFEYEILIGEDSSNDGTRELCIEYAKKHPSKIRLFLHDRSNVIYINNNPTGRYNFLYNLSQARGKYIALCEGDDFWTDKLKLQKQADFLESNPKVNLTFHPVYVFREEKRELINSTRGERIGKLHTTKDFILGVPASTLSMVFRNDILLPKWFKTVYGGDKYLAILLSLAGDAYCFKERMGVYRVHSKNITNAWAKKNSLLELRNNFRSLNHLNTYTKGRYIDEINKFKRKNLLRYKISNEKNRFKKVFYLWIFSMSYEALSFSSIKNLISNMLSILGSK